MNIIRCDESFADQIMATRFRNAGQVEIQVTRPGGQPVQFDQRGRRNANA